MDHIIGQLAALGAAICWTLCTPCFTLAGRRIGSVSVNILRLAVGGVLLCILTWAIRGLPFPTDASPQCWYWLLASGLIGFFFCDLCLFKSYLLIGPRLALLIVVGLSPLLAVGIEWLFLGESLPSRAIVGMAITLGGVLWVLGERRSDSVEPSTAGHGQQPVTNNQKTIGLVLAFLAMITQAVGFLLARMAVENYDALAATQIRLIAGLAGFAVLVTLTGRWRRVFAGLRDPIAVGWLSLGALTGPVIGVGLCVYSLKFISTGLSLTILSLPPVLILPLSWWLLGEKLTARACIGAVVAVAGVAILFLW